MKVFSTRDIILLELNTGNDLKQEKKRLSTGYDIVRISIVTILSPIQWAENPTTKLDANLISDDIRTKKK